MDARRQPITYSAAALLAFSFPLPASLISGPIGFAHLKPEITAHNPFSVHRVIVQGILKPPDKPCLEARRSGKSPRCLSAFGRLVAHTCLFVGGVPTTVPLPAWLRYPWRVFAVLPAIRPSLLWVAGTPGCRLAKPARS